MKDGKQMQSGHPLLFYKSEANCQLSMVPDLELAAAGEVRAEAMTSRAS